MLRHAALSAAALALLAGCAAHGGWTGPDTQPFAEALADCKARTSAMRGKTERRFAIDTCMTGKGWTRPRRQATRRVARRRPRPHSAPGSSSGQERVCQNVL